MRKYLAMSIAVILLCNIWLAVAQNQSKVLADGALFHEEEYCRVVQDLMMGKIDKPPGAKDYEPPENPELLPRPTPPIEQDRLIIDQYEGFVLPMSPGIAAGYQCFIGGRVSARTSTVTNLKPNAEEWQVIHQWPTSGENAIIITYFPGAGSNSGVFAIYISALGGYIGQYVYFPASHSFSLGIRPEHLIGSEEYTKINFWIFDLTSSVIWSKTYTLSVKQYIETVDAALEHDDTVPPNSLWKTFTNFFVYDKNKKLVNLKASFQWSEHASPNMYNQHDETFYGTNYVYGNLSQRKTPK